MEKKILRRQKWLETVKTLILALVVVDMARAEEGKKEKNVPWFVGTALFYGFEQQPDTSYQMIYKIISFEWMGRG